MEQRSPFQNQKRKNTKEPSSSEDSDDISLYSDDTLDDKSSDEGEIEPEFFFEEVTSLKTSDWVLVEYIGKRSKLYYAGLITETVPAVMCKFIKRRGKGFVFPLVEDKAEIDLTTVKKILPKPIDRRGHHTFKIKFPSSITIV